MNILRLREEMNVRGISINELAEKAAIERNTLYRRFNTGGSKFTVEEAKKIADALSLNGVVAADIFLH